MRGWLEIRARTHFGFFVCSLRPHPPFSSILSLFSLCLSFVHTHSLSIPCTEEYKTPNAPYGDHFTWVLDWELSDVASSLPADKSSDKSSDKPTSPPQPQPGCRVTVRMRIHWLRTTMFRSRIESACQQQQAETVAQWADKARRVCSDLSVRGGRHEWEGEEWEGLEEGEGEEQEQEQEEQNEEGRAGDRGGELHAREGGASASVAGETWEQRRMPEREEEEEQEEESVSQHLLSAVCVFGAFLVCECEFADRS